MLVPKPLLRESGGGASKATHPHPTSAGGTLRLRQHYMHDAPYTHICMTRQRGCTYTHTHICKEYTAEHLKFQSHVGFKVR